MSPIPLGFEKEDLIMEVSDPSDIVPLNPFSSHRLAYEYLGYLRHNYALLDNKTKRIPRFRIELNSLASTGAKLK